VGALPLSEVTLLPLLFPLCPPPISPHAGAGLTSASSSFLTSGFLRHPALTGGAFLCPRARASKDRTNQPNCCHVQANFCPFSRMNAPSRA
jgi:hypothetical protein